MDLVTSLEAAELLDMTPRTFRARLKTPGFPGVIKKGKANYFDKAEVLAWRDAHANDNVVPTADPETGEKLLTLQEAADMLGMTYGSLRTLITRYHDMPLTPHMTHKNRPLFTKAAIHEWNDKRLRRRSTPSDTTTTDVNGLITRDKVAQILGVEPRTVTRYSARDISTTKDFPLPAGTIGSTRLWDPKEILAWHKKTTRSA